VSETGSTGFVEVLVRLQAEATGDDFLLDLGGAAEDRSDAAKPPELTIVAKNSGLRRLTGSDAEASPAVCRARKRCTAGRCWIATALALWRSAALCTACQLSSITSAAAWMIFHSGLSVRS
jgi:hypothetical protein